MTGSFHIRKACRVAIAAVIAGLPLSALAAQVDVETGNPIMPRLNLPDLNSYAAPNRTDDAASPTAVTLSLDALMTEDGKPIEKGMVWRIFGSKQDAEGKLPLVATAKGGSASVALEPGSYFVHAAFGRAGATTLINLGHEPRHKSMVLNAGGLRLEGVLPGNIPMRDQKLTFDIYEGTEDENGESKLILPDVSPGRTVRLNAGTYHIVSNYGDVNATIRADIRVEAGKTTTAKVEHRAAQVTLNLVRGDNGYPLADTAWSILGPSGDIIAENVGAFPTMILAAGDYTVIARNKDRIYQRDIKIRPGRDIVVKVNTRTAQVAADGEQ